MRLALVMLFFVRAAVVMAVRQTLCGCGRVCANKSGGPTRPTLSHHGDEKRDSDRAYGSPRDGHVAALSLPLACTVFYSSASSVPPFCPATNERPKVYAHCHSGRINGLHSRRCRTLSG